MAKHRVFLVWTHALFRESIRLTLSHPDFLWVGTTSDYQTAVQEIVALCPDTVMIEDGDEDQLSRILSILKACPNNIRIVVMSLADNRLSLFQHTEKSVEKADQLVGILLGENV